MVSIFCDSTCDLSPELLKRFSIRVIPLSVFIGGSNYLDGLQINSSKLFQLVAETNEMPKTGAPSIEAYQKAFNQVEDLVYISISSKLSASYQSSLIALEKSDPQRKIAIDSANLSSGIGLLALKASDLSRDGKTAVEIAEIIRQDIPKVHTSFVIDKLDYLYKGGRCSAVENLAASLLKIRPVIEVKPDGTLGVREKLGGSRKKALLSMVDELLTHRTALDATRVFVTHCACPDDAEFLVQELNQLEIFKEIFITEAGSVIASHCGPKTIGILYVTK